MGQKHLNRGIGLAVFGWGKDGNLDARFIAADLFAPGTRAYAQGKFSPRNRQICPCALLHGRKLPPRLPRCNPA